MPVVTLLGTAQDGGRPQAGCQRNCCQNLGQDEVQYPVSLGICDDEGATHLVEATRALAEQLKLWGHHDISTVFLTHAHFGHVDGLGLFGRETLNASGIRLFSSPLMANLLHETPHWKLMLEQGVFLHTILDPLHPLHLSASLTVEAVSIPHRAELSDMQAYVFRGPSKSLLFLPDQDSWEETLTYHHCEDLRTWFSSIAVDIVLLDGTFWSVDELSVRLQHEVPHPPVSETISRLGHRRDGDPEVIFIHLNHTNPLHRRDASERKLVEEAGWSIGEQGMQFRL